MSALAFTILVVMPVGQSGEGRPKVPFDQLQAVKREYEQIFQEYTRARAKAKTDKEIEKAGQVRRARTRPLLRRALDLAQRILDIQWPMMLRNGSSIAVSWTFQRSSRPSICS